MLRSRKKDVRLKPNRRLDKRSSRGMVFENEELRLRTIEINAEVERGQSDIKKLRRENDHLRREMWALRDEYERLENLIKHLDLAGISQSGSQNGGSHTGSCSDDDRDSADRSAPSLSYEGASASGQSCTRCHTNNSRFGGSVSPLYVEASEGRNPDIDNIENYQKAYGRMPRRCSSAGARAWPREPLVPPRPFDGPKTSSINNRPPSPCYETYAPKGNEPDKNIDEEDEDGYAACSHPINSATAGSVLSAKCHTTALNENNNAAIPPETPSEDGHFNLDQIANIARSFQEDQLLHEASANSSVLPFGQPKVEVPTEIIVELPTPTSPEESRSSTPDMNNFSVKRRCRTVIEKLHSNGSQTQVVRESVQEVSSNPRPPRCDNGVNKITPNETLMGVSVPLMVTSGTTATSQSVTFSQSSCHNGVTKQSVTFRQNSYVILQNSLEKDEGSGDASRLVESAEKTRAEESIPNNALMPVKNSFPSDGNDDSGSLVRLHAVDPNTVMFDLADEPGLSHVVVQDVIDELERQLDSNFCVVQGVRLVGSLVYISLDHQRSLSHILNKGLTIHGIRVQLTDACHDAIIISLAGVPHYASDATIVLLVSAFGSVIGEIERRYYKGIDTGERLIRIKLKPNVKVPRHITVGGCRIQVRTMNTSRHETSTLDSVHSSNRNERSDREDDAKALQRHSIANPLESQGSSGAQSEPTRPKIAKSFEYRSQLSVNLCMSAEIPSTAEEKNTKTPPSPVCDSKVHPLSAQGLANVKAYQRNTPPPHGSPNVAGDRRESPPKIRTSVNFEDNACSLKVSNVKVGNTKPGGSASPNGILRKSVSGEDGPTNDEDAAASSDNHSNKAIRGSRLIPPPEAKVARSFSLADTFRLRQNKRGTQRTDSTCDSVSANQDDPQSRGAVSRRDSVRSTESSSRSSRSSKKSGELPWCGCWGNGCL